MIPTGSGRLLLFLCMIGLWTESVALGASNKPKKTAATSTIASPATAASAEKITAIEIQGSKKIDKDAILEKVGSSVGSMLSSEQVAKDIRAIHKLNYFDSVEVDFENGVLKFIVKERPAIARIIFYGNDQVSTNDLKTVLTVKTYDIYDENLVRESVRKLVKFYEEKGYYIAKVDHIIRPAKEDDMVELLFRVREYDKVKIRRISFLGNKAFNDGALKKTLRNTTEGGFFSWMSNGGNFKELEFKNDLQMLQYWYLNEGYVRFKYDPPIVSVSEDKRWVNITIKVDEGKKYNIGNIDFGGDLLFPKEELHDLLTLKQGNVFSIIKRNADILALTEKYQDLGYANTNVTPNMEFDDEKLLVHTNYEFEKGTLVRFSRITVKGNSKTRDKVVRRELKIREGDLYSGSGMRISKENVERLGFFEQESVQFQTKSPAGRPDLMDVEINLKERPTGQFQLGAGYSTATRFFFSTSVAETNFLGRGQEIRFQGNMAADRKNRSVSVSFDDPYIFDTLWSAGAELYSTVASIPDRFTEFRKGMALRVGHPITEYSRLYLGYRLEKLTIPDDNTLVNPFIRANRDSEQGTLSAVSVTAQYDRRNNRMETTDGQFASLKGEYAGIGGNRNFVRSIGDVRFYRKIIGDLVFRVKLQKGTIWNYSDHPVQTSELFSLGGADNLRGYNFLSIGPQQNIGGRNFLIGGRNELFGMSELEYPLAREIGLKAVLFYDAGDAFNEYHQLAIKQDWGWGFRWFSPLGPLRFEWGYPLQGKGDGTQFNFMIGPPF